MIIVNVDFHINFGFLENLKSYLFYLNFQGLKENRIISRSYLNHTNYKVFYLVEPNFSIEVQLKVFPSYLIIIIYSFSN
jgi:hypothetical protein